MARLTINISDSLNDEMRKYIKNNDMTITTFLHLAITTYLSNESGVNKYIFKEKLEAYNKGFDDGYQIGLNDT